MKTNVRTRFAPSPTGFLHVGAARTALFAWLLARQNNGTFILRLEDTDQKREVEGADLHIMKSLKALGLEYDEGPDKGGDYGPYRQSERLELYKKWAEKLVENGRAYADPYASSDVQEFREQAQKDKKPFLYRNHRPSNPPKWDGSQPLRFKSDPKQYTWNDAVMGETSTGPEVIDDFVLIKSDGYPTYNFAHIIDDYLMECTHVIRGQEFMSSTPNYLNLYEALEIERPILATMPPIIGPDGKKKLSKRDGAKDILDYLKDGFLEEGLINFIATLGWNDGTEQEIFTVEELTNKFSLDRVQKSGAKFDDKRLLWTNGAHIRNQSLDDLYIKTKDFWPESAHNASDEYKKQVLALTQERLKFLAELPELTNFFFEELPVHLELIKTNKKLKKYDQEQLVILLDKSISTIEESSFSSEDLQEKLNQLLIETDEKPAVLFSLIRIALTWAPSSPGLADSMSVLGKNITLGRLKNSLEKIKKQ